VIAVSPALRGWWGGYQGERKMEPGFVLLIQSHGDGDIDYGVRWFAIRFRTHKAAAEAAEEIKKNSSSYAQVFID